MRPTLAIVAAALIVTVGCSSKKADQPADSPAAAPAPATQAAAPPPASAEPAKVVITDGLVAKYMDYQKQQVALVSKFVEDSRKNLAAAKGDTAKLASQISLNEQMTKELDAALKAKRAEMGLSESEFTTLQDAVGLIANGRLLYNQMGGDAQLAKLEADQKKQLAALPPAQRAEAEKASGEMLRSLKEMKDGPELRKKYGDQAADILLKHADELAQQQMEAYKMLGKK